MAILARSMSKKPIEQFPPRWHFILIGLFFGGGISLSIGLKRGFFSIWLLLLSLIMGVGAILFISEGIRMGRRKVFATPLPEHDSSKAKTEDRRNSV